MLLSNSKLKALDEFLFNYRHLPSRIARRKLEIETEHTTDVNQGGSKPNHINKRTEWLVERFDSDNRLKALETQKEVVETLLQALDDELLKVFKLRWISGKDEEELAETLKLKPRLLKKKVHHILEVYAELLGW